MVLTRAGIQGDGGLWDTAGRYTTRHGGVGELPDQAVIEMWRKTPSSFAALAARNEQEMAFCPADPAV
ncbi:MAG: hypothetical protein ACLRXC_08145 [[Clostridium] leptum]